MYFCVWLYHRIIVLTSGFTQHVVNTLYGCDLITIWIDCDNITILGVGVLLLFLIWMVCVRCNGNCMIYLLILHLHYTPQSYWYLYWSYFKHGWLNWRCGVVWYGVVFIIYNIWLLLWSYLVTCPGQGCTIYYRYGTLRGGKKSLLGDTHGIIGGVAP